MQADERYMRLALQEAEQAALLGEIPVGAVAVLGTAVVGRGANSSIGSHDPTAHAEIVALRAAATATRNYRLTGATLYCTVEPCLMCVGAMLHARIGRLVYGAADPKVGAAGRLDALSPAGADFNWRFDVQGGVLADEAATLLRNFFRVRRIAAGAELEDVKDGEVPKWP